MNFIWIGLILIASLSLAQATSGIGSLPTDARRMSSGDIRWVDRKPLTKFHFHLYVPTGSLKMVPNNTQCVFQNNFVYQWMEPPVPIPGHPSVATNYSYQHLGCQIDGTSNRRAVLTIDSQYPTYISCYDYENIGIGIYLVDSLYPFYQQTYVTPVNAERWEYSDHVTTTCVFSPYTLGSKISGSKTIIELALMVENTYKMPN